MNKKLSIISKFIVIAVSLFIIVGGLANPISMPYTIITKAESKTDSVQAIGINVAYHTEDEIRNYIKTSGATPESPVNYKDKPSIKAPYNEGSLTDETLSEAIKMLNQIRYVAGISYNVSLNNEYIAKAQAASLVTRVNSRLSHYPERPLNMEESLYQLGAQGAGKSNIAFGYDTINKSLVYGYMNDGDDYNIDRVGHRRWILNPKMSASGFGYCERFSAMYALDKANTYASEYGVVWPAQTMPTDYFGADYPWSVSMGYDVNIDSVHVKLVRVSDNRTWNFSNSSADGYFNVDNGGYGQAGCIIFRPNNIEGYIEGDKFNVTISGLNTPVSYQVSFFDLLPVISVEINKKDTKITKGEEMYLEPIFLPANASNQSLKWTSSNEKIATVSEYGEVTGKSYGSTTITATSLSNGLKAVCEIIVVPDFVDIDKMSSSKKGQLTVYYPTDKFVSGYEIVYATNKKFTKNKKTKLIKKATASKVTISGLKDGKVYYIKMRAYVLVNGKKVYGDYGYSVDW